jgi:hypothetical protein
MGKINKVLGTSALIFLVTGLAMEYAAIWINQWAERGQIGLTSDLLQSSFFINLVFFIVFCFAWLATLPGYGGR